MSSGTGAVGPLDAPLANFLQGLGNPALLCDDLGRLRFFNQAAVTSLGYAPDKLAAMGAEDLYPGISEIWELFLEQGVFRGRFDVRIADGSFISTHVNGTANALPGMHLTLAVFPHDVMNDPSRGATLTDRERGVLLLLADGASWSEIALALGIAEETVQKHTANLKGKMEVVNRTELVSIALRTGLLEGLMNGERIIIHQAIRDPDGSLTASRTTYVGRETLRAQPLSNRFANTPIIEGSAQGSSPEMLDIIGSVLASGRPEPFRDIVVTPGWSGSGTPRYSYAATGTAEPLTGDRILLRITTPVPPDLL